MKECKQVNIPSVDNTQENCAEVIREQCVVATKSRTTPIKVAEGDSLESILDKLFMEIRSIKQELGI